MRAPLVAGVFVLGLAASPALADPCEAPLPTREGQTFSGPIGWVIDGDSICVRTADGLVEVRLEDADAAELGTPEGEAAKRRMMRNKARHAVCTVRRGRNGRTTSYDRVIAVCRVGGVSLGR
ncbi:nuclease [Brevundimonas sp.]|uniref:thermonuclease family protein n=1 Tax=Brevundimonas sp. TaxID=1871086 RepID=UPI002D70B1A0|nr:nuclease [Brevundimonas sp.]HYD26926.1 nuclease [Brevundimonas sp.]